MALALINVTPEYYNFEDHPLLPKPEHHKVIYENQDYNVSLCGVPGVE